MKSSILFFILISVAGLFLYGCKEEPKKPLSKCDLYDHALNGVFQSPGLEGTMVFNGGRQGTVDISGADFNDITCIYTITDCDLGQADMSCQGAAHVETILVYSVDSIKIGARGYGRIKNL